MWRRRRRERQAQAKAQAPPYSEPLPRVIEQRDEDDERPPTRREPFEFPKRRRAQIVAVWRRP